MHNVIRIQTVAGPVQATSELLALALAELVEEEHRATEADLLQAVLVPLDDDEAGKGGAAGAGIAAA